MQYGKIGKSVLRHRRSEPISDSSHHGDFFFFTLIINNLALTYSLKYDNANKMRQCENIFVFIDLTKSIGSDRVPPPNSAYGLRHRHHQLKREGVGTRKTGKMNICG